MHMYNFVAMCYRFLSRALLFVRNPSVEKELILGIVIQTSKERKNYVNVRSWDTLEICHKSTKFQ